MTNEAIERAVGMCRAHGLHGTEQLLRALQARVEELEARADLPAAVTVKREEIAKQVYDAMVWAAQQSPPPNGAAYPSWQNGNSDAETEARKAADAILSQVNVTPAPVPPAAVTVKSLKIAEQYADKIIETEFGDYVMKENERYSPDPTEFLGTKIQQRKYHIKLNGMLVLHTDDPAEFLPIVQADYERRILCAITPAPPSPAAVTVKSLARNQPCGCVVCQCENEDQCQGCGAKNCGNHPVGEIPDPVYADTTAPVAEPDACIACDGTGSVALHDQKDIDGNVIEAACTECQQPDAAQEAARVKQHGQGPKLHNSET